MKFIAKTFEGLEKVLYEELTRNKFSNPQILRRAVSFEGNIDELYRANYVVSLAIKILWEIAKEKVFNDKDLYNLVYNIDWHKYFSVEKNIKVDVVLYSKYFKNSLYLAQKAKDAIADRFRKETNKRPNVDLTKPDIIVNIHITDQITTILLDSSGEPLNKRGYRKVTSIAPLNEVLARGLLALSEWDMNTPLLDPMCGSGTIPIEAYYMLNNLPSSYLRNNFAFMHWNNYDKTLWNKIKEKENAKISQTNTKILGTDIQKQNIDIATINLKQLPISKNIYFYVNDFLHNKIDLTNSFIISNLPYNERIQLLSISNFYKDVGNVLKFNYKTNTAWLLLPKNEAKYISLKPQKKIPLLNANIECTFNRYDIY